MEWKNVTSVQTTLYVSCVNISKCIEIDNAAECECFMEMSSTFSEEKDDWNATFFSYSTALKSALIIPNCIVVEIHGFPVEASLSIAWN